jgi:hypothetical protein
MIGLTSEQVNQLEQILEKEIENASNITAEILADKNFPRQENMFYGSLVMILCVIAEFKAENILVELNDR